MGIKRGLFFGFLAGSAIASLLAKSRKAEAPAAADGEAPIATAGGESGAGGGPLDLKHTLDAVKRRAAEVLEAAHEAKSEKEEALRREFDESRHKHA